MARREMNPKDLLVTSGGVVISNGDIARGTGINRTHISRIFSRKRKPSLAYAVRIAGFLGVSVEKLYAHIAGGNANNPAE